jgi:hypothetical protein
MSADESDDSTSNHSTYQQPSQQSRMSTASPRTSNNLTCAAKSPAKKSQSKCKGPSTKKKGQKSIQLPSEESLQGLGPIPTHGAKSQNIGTEPRIYASIINNRSHKKTKRGSVFWQYVYGLNSDIQPASYSLEATPVLKKKPKVKDGNLFIGCRLCNQPPPGQKQSL